MNLESQFLFGSFSILFVREPSLGLVEKIFRGLMCILPPNHRVKVLKGTQSTDRNQWPGFIVPSFPSRLQMEWALHIYCLFCELLVYCKCYFLYLRVTCRALDFTWPKIDFSAAGFRNFHDIPWHASLFSLLKHEM